MKVKSKLCQEPPIDGARRFDLHNPRLNCAQHRYHQSGGIFYLNLTGVYV